MTGRTKGTQGRVLAIAVAGVVLAGCSITTPRHGFTAATHLGLGGTQSGVSQSGPGEAGGAGGSAATGGSSAAGVTGGGASGVVGSSGSATGSRSTGGGSTSGRSGTSGGAGTGAAGGARGSTVGLTKDTITISAMAGFSGNYGPILDKIYDNGFGTWVHDVNTHGGINGRKIKDIKVDNHDTEAGGVAACKTIQGNGSFMAVSIVGFGGADLSSVDCLDKAGITTLAFNLSGWRNEWRHVFSAGDAGKQGTPMASFIRNVIGDANGKIGVIHVEDPVNNAVRAAVVAELKRLGMNVFHEETVQANQGSYIAELQRMAGATTVALAVNGNEVLGILRDANAMNFKPNWTGSFWPTDEDAASRSTLYAGIKAIRNYASTNAPAFEDYKTKATAAGHNDLQTSTTMALYGLGLAVGKALANAGTSPTREGLGPGIEAITNYNNGITMTLSFGPGVRVADVGMWPIQCCNGDNTWRGIGDPKKAF